MIDFNYDINEYNNIKYNTKLCNSLLVFNIRSFNKNINKFLIFLDTLKVKPSIIIFTETWLTDLDDPTIYLPNYSLYQKNRLLKVKKGVVGWQYSLYLHLNLNY